MEIVLDPASWAVQPALPLPVQHHRVAELGGSLHVVGGRDRFNKLQTAVWRAPIGRDGTLAAWTRSADLPGGVAQHGLAALNGSLWVVGGLRAAKAGEGPSDEVLRGTPDRGGAIKGWTRAGRLPEGVSGHAVVAAAGRLWCLGGMGPGGYRNAVWSAEPGDGRAPLVWKPATPLPVALAHAAVAVVDRYLIVVGGQTPGEGKTLVVPTAYVGPIFDAGTIPTWYLAASKLPGAWLSFGRNQANLLAWKNTLFCFGGQDALWFLLESVAAAAFDAKRGDLGPWGVIQGAVDMPQLTAAAGWKEFVYLVGGTVKGAVTARVVRGTFAAREDEEGT